MYDHALPDLFLNDEDEPRALTDGLAVAKLPVSTAPLDITVARVKVVGAKEPIATAKDLSLLNRNLNPEGIQVLKVEVENPSVHPDGSWDGDVTLWILTGGNEGLGMAWFLAIPLFLAIVGAGVGTIYYTKKVAEGPLARAFNAVGTGTSVLVAMCVAAGCYWAVSKVMDEKRYAFLAAAAGGLVTYFAGEKKKPAPPAEQT